METVTAPSYKHLQFLRMGYDEYETLQAIANGIDWHVVEKLLQAGCDRKTALEIAC